MFKNILFLIIIIISMSTKKTISINPDLFNITRGRTKTKKNVSKPLVIPPLISSNILKHKFLERIKKHKIKETEGLENNKKKLGEPNNNSLEKSKNTYTDEFNDSISYLQSLSNQKKIDKKKELLNSRTIKKHDTYIGGMTPSVNLDLPEELIETINPSSSSMLLKYNDVPYGILKGGSKPTYREYNKTQRNFEVINPRQALVIDNVQTINSINNSDREKRMTNLKEKLLQKKMEKEKHTKIDYSTPSTPSTPFNTSIINVQTEIPSNNSINNNNNSIINNSIIEDEEINNPTVAFESDIKELHQPQNEINNVPIKKILKKTIKKNYTLGKSTINKTVGVLLKDRATRKKVLNAHKEIKKHNINDVKEYLRNHNLIKIGGNAPNDVIRKMYEASMLTGEVTNINKEAMIHNFIKDDNK
jgi:hypothetical protein